MVDNNILVEIILGWIASILIMSVLDFIDTGFIITLGLILILCGGIMFYCYRRLNILENSIFEHGRILQTFIILSPSAPHPEIATV